jgi:hypothetical protein
MKVVAHDATSWVESVAEHTQQAVTRRASGRIWLPSFLGLGATDIAYSSSRISRAAKGLAVVGAAGGAGLIAASSLDLWHAKTPEDVLDASGDLAWGAQGLTYIIAAPTAARFVTGLGLVGAAAQMSSGVMRIVRGVSLRDKQALKLGGLDLSGGILWAALDVAAWSNPVVLGSYVVLMVGREAYANKDALRRSWLSNAAVKRVTAQVKMRTLERRLGAAVIRAATEGEAALRVARARALPPAPPSQAARGDGGTAQGSRADPRIPPR